jgi:proteasome lid subunit RPN8/RPN11
VIGSYHSHPDFVATPSAFDLEHLAPWPTLSCIIVSVNNGVAGDVRCWKRSTTQQQFVEEEIVLGD